MPNRTIRDGCRASEALDSLSPEAERMFWRLLTVADDFGRFDARPIVMLVDCFKLMAHKVTVEQVSGWYAEMELAGLVIGYMVDEKAYGAIVKWGQRRRNAFSKFPAPYNIDCPDDGHLAVNCTSTDGHLTPEVRGTRVEVRGTRNEVGNGGRVTAQLAEEGFILTLKDDPTYKGIDIDKEFGKCQNWINVNVPGKAMTRRRFINWLNRADVPMKSQTRSQHKGLFTR